MASADFCGLTPCITAGRAVWSDGSGPVRSLEIGLRDLAPGCFGYGTTQPSLPSAPHRQGAQISPGKSRELSVHKRRIYRRLRTGGLCCHVPAWPSHPSALTMRFVSLASHLCSRASSRPLLAESPLPSASGYPSLTMSPSRYSHRGLAPHKFAPILGAYLALNRAFCGGPRLGYKTLAQSQPAAKCRLALRQAA